MKKSAFILLTALISIAATTAFAKEESCPDVFVIRESGSNFAHAFKPTSKTGEWILSSNPYEYDDHVWQTHYISKIDAATDPTSALFIGQNDFDHSTLDTHPHMSVFGTEVQCSYAPVGATYLVVAMNQVDAGLKLVK